MIHWKQLHVWQNAHELVLEIYKVTLNFPREEIYGLTSQLRRAAVSVPANIVEGQSRHTTKEYISFLYNARASFEETRYHLYLARDLGYISNEKYQEVELKCVTVSKMLNKLIHSLQST